MVILQDSKFEMLTDDGNIYITAINGSMCKVAERRKANLNLWAFILMFSIYKSEKCILNEWQSYE